MIANESSKEVSINKKRLHRSSYLYYVSACIICFELIQTIKVIIKPSVLTLNYLFILKEIQCNF